MVQVSPNPRKRRRFLENEFYAKDARFWIGRMKTADRSQELRPINRQAATVINRPKHRNSQISMVYVVRFILRSDPSLTFIKVGITSANPMHRFKLDAKKFDLIVIETIKGLKRNDALALEAALLELFAPKNFRPPVVLGSGNSECFVYTEELQEEMKSLLSSYNKPV